MSSSRLIIILSCAFVGASFGIARQALRIANRPQAFRSMAKLVGQTNFNDSARWREQQLDFYGTIIETLESAEMKRRALERVKALNPELRTSEVEIRVVRSKDTSLFNLLATGPDPKYTKIFLDALIDEYFAFREGIRDKSQGKMLQQETHQPLYHSSADYVTIQERASPATEYLEDWRRPIAAGASGGGLLGALIGLVLSLLIVRSPKPPQVPAAL